MEQTFVSCRRCQARSKTYHFDPTLPDNPIVYVFRDFGSDRLHWTECGATVDSAGSGTDQVPTEVIQ
jgi:hypothetical protein